MKKWMGPVSWAIWTLVGLCLLVLLLGALVECDGKGDGNIRIDAHHAVEA